MAMGKKGFDSQAIVGALRLDQRFLVIRRSDKVIAPGKLCFPGGGIEEGESLVGALQREFREEVGLSVEPLRQVWINVTSWRCKVHWWEVSCQNISELAWDEREVAECHWKSAEELLDSPDLLESNRHFLELVRSGEINLCGA